MPRLLPLAALALALAACDSNDLDDLDRIEGRYQLDALVFDPSARDLADADVGARLDLDDTELQVFGDGDADLEVFFEDGTRSQRTGLTVDAASTRAAFEAVTNADEDELARLLLPPRFTLRYDGGDDPRTLEAEIPLSAVNLQAFDADRYQGLTGVSGTLTVRFVR